MTSTKTRGWSEFCTEKISEALSAKARNLWWQRCSQGYAKTIDAVAFNEGYTEANDLAHEFEAWQSGGTPPQEPTELPVTIPQGSVPMIPLPAKPSPWQAVQKALAGIENKHPCLEEIVGLLLSGSNPYLYGPAGCGKSFAAEQAAKVLGDVLGEDITFADMVGSPNMTEFDLLAKAMPKEEGGLTIIRSPFLKGSLAGNVLCFYDEADNSPPDTNISLNGVLASRRIYDPTQGQTVPVNEKNFFILAAGNTNLNGPTPEFPARQQQDSAFISRFRDAMIKVDYSETLEAKILDPRVCAWLQEKRSLAAGKGLGVELSTRLGVGFTKQINAGFFSFKRIQDRWAEGLTKSQKDVLRIV